MRAAGQGRYAEGDPDLAYTGFHIPADFVVGYGLDAAERYRNLPYICVYEGPSGA